jgi:hypothetical protein
MASASRLLGRNMALYLDGRDTLLAASSVIYGYQAANVSTAMYGAYNHGTPATSRSRTDRLLLPHARRGEGRRRDARHEERAAWRPTSRSVHPHQSRRLRDTPEFIEVTKYAAPGNFDARRDRPTAHTVFIETTQVKKTVNGAGSDDADLYQSIIIGDNAFGHAISLPVELRDGGILDFVASTPSRWYSIWGMGLITDQSIVIAETN